MRSKASKKANRHRKNWLKKQDRHPSGHGIVPIPSSIPTTTCEHCHHEADTSHQRFDEHGFLIQPKAIALGKRSGASLMLPASSPILAAQQIFRFLDLPPEIRIRIYELVVYRPKQPVCVPDHLLFPSEDLQDGRSVLRECHADVICLPCQLHELLQTGHIGLSRANMQLHREMALIPYAVNTFSVHNLYYLQMFLRLIGQNGRKVLKSLRFDWILLEEEATAFKMFTSIEETYTMLGECTTLTELSVNMDVKNLLTWKGSGRRREESKQSLSEMPYLDLISQLRGLRNIRIAWKIQDGVFGMKEWARALAGHWRLPRGSDGLDAVAVEAEAQISDDGKWRFIHWNALEHMPNDS